MIIECEKTTHSYIKLPENFPKRNTKPDEIGKSTVNNLWVSIAVGSEHYTFATMRKNQYEEVLFKCEDERFEFDININIYKRGIFLLEKIAKNLDREEERKRDFDKLIKLKILQSLYGNKLNEFIEEFNKGENLSSLVEIFLNRLKTKVEFIKTSYKMFFSNF